MSGYAEAFGVTRWDKWRFLVRYPLFRVVYEATYRRGRRQRAARRLLQATSKHTFTHRVSGPHGAFDLAVGFSPDDLGSFREIFFGLAYDIAIDNPRTVVDLGANIGMASCYFAARFPLERVLAVEANPELAHKLRANMNRIPADVIIEVVAVTGQEGAAQFTLHDNHRHSKVTPDGAASVQIPSRTLRSLLEQHGIESVDILKIDIEGAEYSVVLHDPQVLLKARSLMIEIHGSRADRDSLAATVEQQGFDIHVTRGHAVDALVGFRRHRASADVEHDDVEAGLS